jgi:hypothetical protein
MAFVGAGSTTDTNVHEKLEGPVLVKPLPDPFENDFLPIAWEFPIFVDRRPFSGIG